MMSIITKRSWKIRFSFIFVFIPVFLFLSACSLRHTSPLPLNESVVHLLEIMGYHDCNILSLADYETLATQYEVCYDKCEDDIKLYLVIGAIAYCEDIHMDTSTFESYCLSYGLDPLSINEEDSCYIH